MNVSEINQAFLSLYDIARTALVDGDKGDVRDNSAKIIQDALNNYVIAEKELLELKDKFDK